MFKKLSLGIAIIVLLAACGSSVSPTPTTTSPTPSVTNPVESKYRTFYFVADTAKGFRLFSEDLAIEVPISDVESVLAALVAGEIQPLDPDYTNLWNSPSAINSVDVTAELITIDFAEVELNVGAETELRALQQLIWTATGIVGDMPVQFKVNGEIVESLAGHVDVSMPMVRSESYEVLNDIQITSLDTRDSISAPVTVTGFACTFEANVAYELWRDGILLEQGSTLANEACPVRSSFEIEFGELAAGVYVVKAFELSAKDGSLSSIDTKSFRVE